MTPTELLTDGQRAAIERMGVTLASLDGEWSSRIAAIVAQDTAQRVNAAVIARAQELLSQ